MATETEDINYEESFIKITRGLKLFTCKWLPMNQEPRALVFLCHGYGMECSITMNSTARRLVRAGFGVYGMDYEGHGKSDGLSAYVPNFDHLVDDVSAHYTTVCEREENKGKMRFVLGESMGGAVVLLLHRKKPEFWDGALLVAPMCKIAEEMKPSPFVISMLTKLISVIPKWKIIPSQDIIEISYKEPEIRKQVRENHLCYQGRPRLKTAYELLRISNDLEKRLQEVSLPFMVLHGDDDKVTDKAVSQELYKVAMSSDKTLKLYSGMWHGLLTGETQENIDIVFADVIGWLEKRTAYGNDRYYISYATYWIKLWDHMPIPYWEEDWGALSRSAYIDGKFYLMIGSKVMAYDPQEGNGTWSKDIWDTKLSLWKDMKGLKGLPKFGKNVYVKMADYGGKMAVFGDNRVRYTSSGDKNKTIWFVVIVLERPNSEEIWGKAEWHEPVLTVPMSYEFEHALAVTV